MAQQYDSVTIDLTPEQQEKLRQATKGNFTAATFVFGPSPNISPPEHTVSCKLVRVAASSGRGKTTP